MNTDKTCNLLAIFSSSSTLAQVWFYNTALRFEYGIQIQFEYISNRILFE